MNGGRFCRPRPRAWPRSLCRCCSHSAASTTCSDATSSSPGCRSRSSSRPGSLRGVQVAPGSRWRPLWSCSESASSSEALRPRNSAPRTGEAPRAPSVRRPRAAVRSSSGRPRVLTRFCSTGRRRGPRRRRARRVQEVVVVTLGDRRGDAALRAALAPPRPPFREVASEDATHFALARFVTARTFLATPDVLATSPTGASAPVILVER